MSDNSFTDGYIMTIGDLFNEEQLSIIRETLNDYTIDFNITPVTSELIVTEYHLPKAYFIYMASKIQDGRMSESSSKLQKFYINTYSKILKQQPLQYESFIPTNIYGRSSQDVAANMVRQCVKSVAEKWVAWETETKELYEEMYIELMNQSEVQAALFI